MKEYKKPSVVSNSRTENIVPLAGAIAAIAALNVAEAALIGAAAGLALGGSFGGRQGDRDFRMGASQMLKPVVAF